MIVKVTVVFEADSIDVISGLAKEFSEIYALENANGVLEKHDSDRTEWKTKIR
jgi:hypothetical protein